MFQFLVMFFLINLMISQTTVSGVQDGNKNEFVDPSFKVKVECYYQTHCPHCVKFETTQLVPTMEQLGQYIDLHMHPYGKAQMHEEGGVIKFTCQNGEKECHGNKLQACAIEKLGLEKALKYNSCMLQRNSTDAAADKCARLYGIDSGQIKNCAYGQEGDQLMKQHGEETAKVRSRFKKLPFVVINGKKLKTPNTPGSFFRAVCAALGNKPTACKQNI